MATVYKYTLETDASGTVKSLKIVEDQAEKTSDAVDRVGKSAKKTKDAAERLGDASGRTASAMGMLGGVLGRIDPALEEGARGIADIADSLDAATMFGMKAARVMGVVGAAVAAGGAAYVVLNRQLEAANQLMEEQAEQANRMADIHRKVKEAALLAALAQGEITQAQFNSISAAQTANDLFRQQRAQQRQSLTDAQNALDVAQAELEQIQASNALRRQRLDDEQTYQRVYGDFIAMEQRRAQTVAQLTEERNNAARQLGATNIAESEYAANLEIVANASNEVADSQQAVTERVKEGTEAIKTMTVEVMTLAEAFASLGFGAPGGVGIGIDLADPMSAQLGSMRERLELLQRQIEIRQRLQNLPSANGRMALPTMNAGVNIAQGLGFIGAPSSALAAFGPAGAIFTALASIGQIGAQGISDQLEDLTNNVAEGVRALPTILLDVFPDFVDQLAAVLPEAIADAISELFVRLLDRIPGLEAEMGEDGLQVGLDRSDVGGQLLNFLTAASPALGLGVRNVVGLVNNRQGNSSSARASTQGRLMRADGAQRLAMSRAPTSTMFGQGATVIQQALGFDSGTQDRFQRRFSQLIDADTGLRGRT